MVSSLSFKLAQTRRVTGFGKRRKSTTGRGYVRQVVGAVSRPALPEPYRSSMCHRTQIYPEERWWISKRIWKDPLHKESRENPKLTPYKLWFETP